MIHAELAKPDNNATVSRWLGGVEGRVLVLWESGDDFIVALHNADSGERLNSLITEHSEGVALQVAGDRATVLFGDVQVDLTTGAMSTLVSPLTEARAIWQGIVGAQAGEPVLVTGTVVEQIGSGSVTDIMTGTPSGAIIVATDGAVGMYPVTARGK